MEEKSVPRLMLARGRALAAGLVATFAVALGAAAPAFGNAALKQEFLPFAACPVTSAAICVVATTSGGEFVIDRKTVPINKTITLQGGLGETGFAAQSLIPPTAGEALSKTPLTVPGGLVGIEGLGGEVTATAEIAGPPSSVIVSRGAFLSRAGAAVTLPLKVKLENSTLGEECYIGSDAEPILLHLTTGTTSPPSTVEPIKGTNGEGMGGAKGKITRFIGDKLVDNDFAVPGASGCGGSLSGVIDEVVDLDVGIPAEPGQSTAIMSGAIEETHSEFAAKYKPKEKKSHK